MENNPDKIEYGTRVSSKIFFIFFECFNSSKNFLVSSG